MLNRTCILLVVVATSVVGCSTTEPDFRQAAQINTIDSYREFVNKHPKGKLSEEAKRLQNELITEADFKDAVDSNTVASYESFIARHPQSPLTQQARSSIQAIEKAKQVQEAEAALFSCVSETDTPEAYEGFIRDHPNSEFVAQAKVGLKNLAAANDLAKIAQGYKPPLRTYSVESRSNLRGRVVIDWQGLFTRNLRRTGLSLGQNGASADLALFAQALAQESENKPTVIQGGQSADLTVTIDCEDEWVQASGSLGFPSKGLCLSCLVKVQDPGAEMIFEKKYSVGPLVPRGGVSIQYTDSEPKITIDPTMESMVYVLASHDIQRIVDENFLSDFRDALKR